MDPPGVPGAAYDPRPGRRDGWGGLGAEMHLAEAILSRGAGTTVREAPSRTRRAGGIGSDATAEARAVAEELAP